MILLIDNYDSFTYNVSQLIEEIGYTCLVKRNDMISIAEIEVLAPKAILLSPGPGYPREAGITLEAIRHFAGRIPLFGICLGHQAIGEAFGARVVRASRLKHGKLSRIHHDAGGLFVGIPNPFIATRYHSLILERESLPECLEVTCQTKDGLIMGVRHKQYSVEGVQFHPEAVATESGRTIMKEFLGRIAS